VALIVLDASVLIAHLDPADALHRAAQRAFSLYANDELRLPASAYSEFLVDAVRGGRIDEARDAVERMGVRIEPIDAPMADAAARLRARSRSLRLPDALVIACGEVLNADVVLTGDRRWRRFDRVRVLAAK